MSNQQNAYVIGVGLTPFIKPRATRQYHELGYEAGIKAMLDAQINYDEVQTGIACFCYGETTSGQKVFYQFGMTGIPIYNTNNACATGSSGIHLARNLVRANVVDVALVVGFEQMSAGSIKSNWTDRPAPTELAQKIMHENRGKHDSPWTAQSFANAGREYMDKYGATAEDMAEIARVSHEHSTRNPYAQFRKEYTLKEVLESPMIHAPLTKLQCSPTSDGAGAAVIVSERYLSSRPHLREQAILISGQALLTDTPELYSRSDMDLVGYNMTGQAAAIAMKEAGIGPKDVDVCELHDCFSCNELITIEGLGFSEIGKAHEVVRRGDITYGGKGPIINPSGGLISKGHPIGATGLAQCAELCWHLRGWANNRFVDTKVALQHNLGLGGAVVVTIYQRADKQANRKLTDSEIKAWSALGYNPAVEAKTPTAAQADKVRSKKARSDYALSDTQQKMLARL